MSQLLKDARNLAANFRNSTVYLDYKKAKYALESDPLLLERVKAYKENSLALEMKRMTEGAVSFDEEKRVAHQYSELSLQPVCGAFLACEFEMMRVYKEVMDAVGEGFEFD